MWSNTDKRQLERYDQIQISQLERCDQTQIKVNEKDVIKYR